MTTLQMFVRFVDGTGRVERTERDTPEARRVLDREARLLMASPRVLAVEVEQVQGRTVGYLR